jgi:hypothetical protein
VSRPRFEPSTIRKQVQSVTATLTSSKIFDQGSVNTYNRLIFPWSELIEPYAMKMYGGVDVLIHVFFYYGTRRRSVGNFTPRLLNTRGKSPRYPLGRWLGGPQSRSGRRGGEKNLAPTGTRTPTPRLSSL